ncbi:LptF/LptG family permease [Pelagibacteraceae bacterium]|nr:LptF/LptG family permease [Pelagibacteraceae bacterium]
MLQNKIYHNFIIEIFKTFLIILFGFSVVALTVRAVNFLDLIVDSGYQITTYFQYSLFNFFGIAPKFIPLSFLLALTIFIIKHKQDSEFIILWTSGVKKIYIVNLFFLASLMVLILYLILSTFLTPLALNKSRQLLSNNNFSSFLPTVKTHQFSDSFKGFTFIVGKKIDNELQNIFLHDKGNNLKNLSTNTSKTNSTTIMAKNGIIDNKKMILFNGQIISTNNNAENEIIKFEQLNIDLSNLTTTTIKKPKIQETSTLELFECLSNKNPQKKSICNKNFKKEILSTLNRRIVIPFYIPVLSLICGMLLIKSKKLYLNNISIFLYSFILLLFTELAVRYTGINNIILLTFILLPFSLFIILYSYLIYKFSKNSVSA